MFGRRNVCELNRLVDVPRGDEQAVSFYCRQSDFTSRQFFQLAFDFDCNFFGKSRVRRDHYRATQRIVFRLAEHVGGGVNRIGCLVGDYQNLARSRQHVYVAMPEDFFFRQCHEDIAGTGDFVDARDRFGSERHCRDRLRASNFINPIDARKFRRRQYIRIDGSSLRRHAHDYFADARHTRGDRIHQHARRISRRPARYVNARPFDRHERLPEDRALSAIRDPRARHLFFVEAFYIRRRPLQRGFYFRLDGTLRCVNLVGRHQNIFGRKITAVYLVRVLEYGIVAAFAHSLDYQANYLNGGKVGAENFFVCFPNTLRQLDLIKTFFAQQLKEAFTSDFDGINQPHSTTPP